MDMLESDPLAKKVMKHLQNLKANTQKENIEKVDASLPTDLLRLVDKARDKEPLPVHGSMQYCLRNMALLRPRYNMSLSGQPSHCACGDVFNTNHAISCRKGRFVEQRRDGI